MTLSWLDIFLIVTSLAPVPAAIIWRMLQTRRNARMVKDMMAERRAKFAGVIRMPGTDKVQMLNRDDL